MNETTPASPEQKPNLLQKILRPFLERRKMRLEQDRLRNEAATQTYVDFLTTIVLKAQSNQNLMYQRDKQALASLLKLETEADSLPQSALNLLPAQFQINRLPKELVRKRRQNLRALKKIRELAEGSAEEVAQLTAISDYASALGQVYPRLSDAHFSADNPDLIDPFLYELKVVSKVPGGVLALTLFLIPGEEPNCSAEEISAFMKTHALRYRSVTKKPGVDEWTADFDDHPRLFAWLTDWKDSSGKPFQVYLNSRQINDSNKPSREKTKTKPEQNRALNGFLPDPTGA